MAGWSRNLNEYTVKCPVCGKSFVPNIEVNLGRAGLAAEDGNQQYYFLFPPLFAKETYNLIEFKGASAFFTPEFSERHQLLFWNTVFYFRLINQPYFMLSLDYSLDSLAKLKEYQASLAQKEAEIIKGDMSGSPKHAEQQVAKYFAPIFEQYRAEKKKLIESRVAGQLAPIASFSKVYGSTETPIDLSPSTKGSSQSSISFNHFHVIKIGKIEDEKLHSSVITKI